MIGGDSMAYLTPRQRREQGIKTETKQTEYLTPRQRREKESAIKTVPFNSAANERKEMLAEKKIAYANKAAEAKKLNSVADFRKLDEKSNKAASIPSFNSKSPFYNTPGIGKILKKDEEKTREVAAKVLDDKELGIFAKGLSYDLETHTAPGNVTLKYFKPGQDVPEDVAQNFSNIWQKVEYAKKGALEKVGDRAARQMVRTAVGDKEAQELAEATGTADAGNTKIKVPLLGEVNVENALSDIAGTVLGYMMPSGSPGGQSMIGASNSFGEQVIRKLGTKIPALIKHPIIGKQIQGLIEDIPLTAYTAMAEKQTPAEAAATYAKQAPYTAFGELGMLGVGKLGSKISSILKKTNAAENVVDTAKKYTLGKTTGTYKKLKTPEVKQLPSAERLLLPEKATASLEAPSVPLTQYEKGVYKKLKNEIKTPESIETITKSEPVRTKVEAPVISQKVSLDIYGDVEVSKYDGNIVTIKNEYGKEIPMTKKRFNDLKAKGYTAAENTQTELDRIFAEDAAREAELKAANDVEQVNTPSLNKTTQSGAQEVETPTKPLDKSVAKLRTLEEKQRQHVASQTGSKVLPEQKKPFTVPEQYKTEMPRRVTTAEIEQTTKTPQEIKKLRMPETVKTQSNLKTDAGQVNIPSTNKMAENDVQKLKTSKFRTNTIERSTMIPDEIKTQIKKEDFDFIPETSKEWQDNAIKNIQNDRASVIKKISEADSVSGGTQAHEAAIITEELVDKAKKGDTDELLEWLPTVAEKTRETARALKGTDTAWDKVSPAGALVKAQRMLDNAVPDEVSKAVKAETKAAKTVLDEINKVNADSVDTVFKDFLNEKPKVTKALREFLDKQETAATQRVKEYFKPTDGIIKLHSGPPGEVLTDLATIGAAKLARKTLDFAEWSAEMIKEFGEKVRPYLKQVYDNSLNLIKSKSMKAPTANIDKTIRQVMSENGVKIQEIARKHVSEIDATGQTLAQKFVSQLGLSEDAAAKVEKIFVQRMKDMTTAKKQQILDQMLKPRKTYNKKSLSDKIIELSNMGAIGEEKYAKVLKEKYGIPELNADDVQKIIKQTEEIQGMSDVFKRQAATNKMMSDIQKKIPSTFGAKAKAYTMVNTLLNPKTILARNVPGNIAQSIAMRTNKAFMSAIDFTTSKLTGKDRTVSFKTNRGLSNVVKEFFSDVKTGTKAGWEGYNPYGTISEFKMATQAFQGKYNPVTYMEKALGATLSGAGDYPFYMKAVMDSIGEQSVLRAMNEGYTGKALKAQAKIYADGVINSAKNMSDFSKSVLDTANRAGEKATFRDANVISSILSGVHDTLNTVGIGKAKATIGKIPSREFGLGDMVIMFAKTPGALLNIGLEYSPLGIAKSLLEMGTGITKASRENITEAITKAVSGTLLLSGTGYYLTAKGAMKGKAPSDKEARNYFDENGEKEYSFNTDAIVRWAKNGFKDDSLLKPQNGDKWYTYDWLSPFAFNVGLGANVAQEGVKLNTLQALPDTLGASMKMFAENDAISNLLNNNSYQDFGERAVQTLVSMPTRFVPLGSIVNQVRQMTDNTKRDTSSDDPKQKAINLIKNRIPGLPKELPAVLTTTGEVKEMYAGGSNNPLNVLLSPGYLGIYKTSPGRKLLIDLYKSTGKTSQFPKLQINKIKIYGTEYPLSNDQKADLQKYVGQMTWSTLDNLVTAKSDKGKEFSDLDDEIKLKVISNLMEEIGNKAELYMADKMKIKKPTKQEEKDKKVEIPKFKMAN